MTQLTQRQQNIINTHEYLIEQVAEAIDDTVDVDVTTEQLAEAALERVADWLEEKTSFKGRWWAAELRGHTK